MGSKTEKILGEGEDRDTIVYIHIRREKQVESILTNERYQSEGKKKNLYFSEKKNKAGVVNNRKQERRK